MTLNIVPLKQTGYSNMRIPNVSLTEMQEFCLKNLMFCKFGPRCFRARLEVSSVLLER